jgi:hypothetical protein
MGAFGRRVARTGPIGAFTDLLVGAAIGGNHSWPTSQPTTFCLAAQTRCDTTPRYRQAAMGACGLLL